ncbi:hypothetical protein DPMN_075298 [Dreissena polymorpha]|uniref:Uncharacterized protein n=1 Tax=Dreissena polymorpha TaxID=45954 RepID=A0A9D4BP98_DREPO|nr:hypothetical protein DPMN_075298 [Dreissena polymorpha]
MECKHETGVFISWSSGIGVCVMARKTVNQLGISRNIDVGQWFTTWTSTGQMSTTIMLDGGIAAACHIYGPCSVKRGFKACA